MHVLQRFHMYYVGVLTHLKCAIRHRSATCNPIIFMSTGSRFLSPQLWSKWSLCNVSRPSSSLWNRYDPVTKELRNHFDGEWHLITSNLKVGQSLLLYIQYTRCLTKNKEQNTNNKTTKTKQNQKQIAVVIIITRRY